MRLRGLEICGLETLKKSTIPRGRNSIQVETRWIIRMNYYIFNFLKLYYILASTFENQRVISRRIPIPIEA